MNPLTVLVARLVFPSALLIAFTHLAGAARGPGDGFTAGIIAALGLTVQVLVFGAAETRRRFPWARPHALVAAGLGAALLAGALPLLAGEAFFGIAAVEFALPLAGELHLESAQLFDVGIFLAVFGGAMTAIDQLTRGAE